MAFPIPSALAASDSGVPNPSSSQYASGRARVGADVVSLPPIGPLGSSRAIFIGPPNSYFGELGELVEHQIVVTNNVTQPVLAELSWNAPPPEWSVAALDTDRQPLPDLNSNGLPDVSLGQARSGTESVVVLMSVQVPSVAPPDLQITTTVVAQVVGTNDSDSVDLVTGIGPWVTLERWADPAVINITGSGGVEETTITLTVRGEGPVVKEPLPLDVVFEVDKSGSMSWNDPNGLRVDAVKLYIDKMTPADRGSVVGFDNTAWVVANRPLTPTDDIGKALLKVDVETLRPPGGGTNLDAALDLGTDWLITYGDLAKRRIEILLTDGIGSTGDTERILDLAVAQGIVIYTVGLGSQIDEVYLKHVADRTGGEYFHADTASQLAELYEKLAERTIEIAASDPDPTDYDPMVLDVLPPFIGYVFGSAYDPSTGAPSPPLLDGVDAEGNRVLGWNVASLAVNETWRVAFRITSSRGGLVPTNVYGLSRVAFDDFRGRPRTLAFPEVFITVLAPPPMTSISVGTPRVVDVATYVTSATPLWFATQDRSATGIRTTMFRVDGSSWIDLTGGGTFSLWVEGEHLVEWFSEDNIGNVEAPRSAVFRVDNSPPLTELLVGAPNVNTGFLYLTSASSLALQSSDGGITPVGIERIEYRIDGSFWGPYSASFNLITEGMHTVEYRAWDLLGNVEPPHTVTLFVDGLGPIFRVTPRTPVYAAADTWVTSHTEIELSAQDRGSPSVGLESFEYRIWFGSWSDWTAYDGPLMLSPEGRHLIEMRARDLLGNEGSASTAFYVDDTPPVLSISIGTPKVVDGGTFITSDTPLSLSAAEAGLFPVGLGSFEYRIDGGPWSTYVNVFQVAGDGAHLVEYRASDLLGNVAASSATVIVDDSPPSLSLVVGTPKHVARATWITSSTEVDFSAVDGGTVPVGLEAVEYREWFGVWTPWTSHAGSFRLSGEGLHTLEIRASDRLGHASATEADVIVDDSPPEAILTVGLPVVEAEARFLTSATPLALFAEDRGVLPVGLQGTEYRLGSGWRPNAESFTVIGSDGPYRVEYRATDLLGHAAEGAIDVILDNTPPETRVMTSLDPETRQALLILEGTDSGSGLASTTLQVNEGTWQSYSKPSVLGTGRHVVRYQSVDRLGNVEPEKLYDIVIPGAAPGVTWNWTPSIAFAFVIVLMGIGVAFARRELSKGASSADAARSAGLMAPFVAGELATGLLSLTMTQLRMPPALGWGLFLLLAVLIAGILVAWLHMRSVRLPYPESAVPPTPSEEDAPPPPADEPVSPSSQS